MLSSDSALSDSSSPASATRQTPSAGLSLRVNFSWTLAGNVVYAGCQWAMLVVLAKLGSPEQVGQFALGLAVTVPVLMLTNLQLRAVQATDARREYLFGDYLALRLVGTLAALLVIAGLAFLSGYGGETAWVVLVIGLAKALESVSDVIFGLLQQRERMNRISISLMVKGVLSLAALGAGVYLTGSVLWGSLGLVAARTAVLLTYDLRSAALVLRLAEGRDDDELRPRWRPRTLLKLAWLGLPLGVVMLLISLNTNVPRYFIAHYLGEHDLGIFAAMASLQVAGTTIVSALGQSASPRLAIYFASGDIRRFRHLLWRMAGLGTGLGTAGVLVVLAFGRQLMTLLYGAEYAAYSDVLFWIMAAAGTGYIGSILGYGITATRQFSRFPPPYALLTFFTAAASFLFIPAMGLVGAAWASGVTGIGSCVIALFILCTTKATTTSRCNGPNAPGGNS